MSTELTLTVTGLILTVGFGLISIFVSVAFFISAKNAETQTSNLLTEIKTQVTMLQRLNNRWMDKTLDYFTQLKQPTLIESLEAVSKVAAQTQKFNILSPPGTSGTPTQTYRDEDILSTVITMYYYIAVSNHLAFGYLPKRIDFDETNFFHLFIKNTLNTTTIYFWQISGFLGLIPDTIAENPGLSLYQDVEAHFKPMIRDAAQAFIAKEN